MSCQLIEFLQDIRSALGYNRAVDISRPRWCHWNAAVYEREGMLRRGDRAGQIGVLISEAGDLRQRIKQYISGTQQRGNKLWLNKQNDLQYD
jgi:hypothetical protein